MKKTLAALLLLEIAVATVPALAGEPLDLFDTDREAVKHCGRDTVVWLTVPTASYRLKGEVGYGRGKGGGYTCRKDADHSHNKHVTGRK